MDPKEQPNNFNKSLRYPTLDQTWTQPIRSWIYKGEWDGTLGRNVSAEARYGMSSVSASHVANNDTTAFGDHRCWPRNPIQNGPTKDQFIFRRPQFSGSLTYFKEGWGGSHEFKVGGVFNSDGRLERPPAGRLGQRPRDAEQRPAGQRDALRADGHIGRRPKGDVQPAQRRPGDGDQRVPHQSMDGQAGHHEPGDSLGPLPRGWSPAQQQLPYRFGPVDIPASTFPTTTYLTWNKVVPRLGLAYNLTDDARTVAKVSWGLYRFDPGIGLADGEPQPVDQERHLHLDRQHAVRRLHRG